MKAIEEMNLEELRAYALSLRSQPSAEEVAIRFHDTYERLAPQFGYETRSETRRFNPESPNGKLMIAVCGEILRSLDLTTIKKEGE